MRRWPGRRLPSEGPRVAKQEVKGAQIRVTECKKVYTGNGANGEFSIYEITAVNKQGVLIQDKLSSFSPLPLGDGVYDMKPYYKNGEFKNWTVSAPKGTSTAALEQRIGFLEEQVEFLVGKVTSIEQQLAAVGSHPGHQPPTPAGRFSQDDDVPF